MTPPETRSPLPTRRTALALGAAALGAGTLGAAFAVPAAAASDASARLIAVAEAVWRRRLANEPFIAMATGAAITGLGDYSLAGAEEEAAYARARLAELDAIPASALDARHRIFQAVLRHDLSVRTAAPADWRIESVVTPYRGGDVHNMVFRVLGSRPLATPADRDAYLGLVRDYARVLDELDARARAQRAAGVRTPRPAFENARKTFAGLQATLPAAVGRGDARAEALVRSDILPRLERLAANVDDKAYAEAPEAVGLRDCPGGLDYYRRQIRAGTGLTLTPEEIHAIGLARVDELEARLADIRGRIGFNGSREAFHDSLRKDPRWIARTPEEVSERYRGYMAKMAPHLPKLFEPLARAPYDVKRLDPAAEPGMTYGYYQAPTKAEPMGLYRWNGSGLADRTLLTAQHLIYHELMPGHHLQLALQQEVTALHPLQAYLFSGACTEGWAEYAAALGDELGLYGPWELYGHYLMQIFLAQRLVVDTGMNALGWSLERGRDYMRAHTFVSEAEIVSESLRYSTDIHGQALGYGLGYRAFSEQRKRAERELGAKFDIKAFHRACLAGQMPMNVLEQQITDYIASAA